MPTLLHVDSSPLESSISRELAREYVAAWKAAHPHGTVLYRDLSLSTPSPIDQAWVHASYTPADARTPEQKKLLAQSESLIDELFAADEVVIAAPMHNFGVPSSLKLWIDQVVRAGRTFQYGANGPKGLLEGKKATLLIATGGEYGQDGPAAALNFVEPYLKTVLGFIGLTNVTIHTVGGVAKLMSGAVDRDTLLRATLTRIRAQVA
jgi:FMN-dependent NADH-azoreductase